MIPHVLGRVVTKASVFAYLVTCIYLDYHLWRAKGNLMVTKITSFFSLVTKTIKNIWFLMKIIKVCPILMFLTSWGILFLQKNAVK